MCLAAFSRLLQAKSQTVGEPQEVLLLLIADYMYCLEFRFFWSVGGWNKHKQCFDAHKLCLDAVFDAFE